MELGTHNGVSYAAFCEAVLAARVDARCYAVDTWTGDEHAGRYGEDVYASLKSFHDTRYATFSTLLRATFDEACVRFADGSIDLLHIDGLHTFEAVRHDWLQWRGKLSDSAVVLFHDTNVRDRDFGVWRLWAELRKQYPSFEFLHGYGLGVLLVGAHVPPEVAALGYADRSAVATIRERFAALGQSHALRYELAAAEERQRALEHSEHAARAESDLLRRRLVAMRAENREAAATLEARYADQQRHIDGLQRDIDALQRDIDILHASTSWRVTGPLRWLRVSLRRQHARLQLVRAALSPQGTGARRAISASLRRRVRLAPSRAAVSPAFSADRSNRWRDLSPLGRAVRYADRIRPRCHCAPRRRRLPFCACACYWS